MAGRLRNKSAGLRLELNTTGYPGEPIPEDNDESLRAPPSQLGTSSSTGTSGNWREDIARIVHHHSDDKKGGDDDMKPDDFKNIQRLGEGAAGTVWKVMHNPSQVVMAKKVCFFFVGQREGKKLSKILISVTIQTITVDPDPQLQRQILRELSFLKTCESPYIVSFYGAFLDDGETTIAICMEYCEGGSLEDIYKRANQIHGVIGETVLANIAESVSFILKTRFFMLQIWSFY